MAILFSPSIGTTFLLCLTLLVDVSRAKDATNKLFQWQFSSSILATQLPTCQEMTLLVKSYNTDNSTHGNPPYYMTSFAIGGLPVTTLLGSDENNLKWTITQPVGSKLLLDVVDQDGSAGGVPPRIFEVVAGQSTQCVQTPPTSNFVVSANVTDKISTCEPWGIRVKGGVPPYTITLAQPNSPVVTNVTFEGPDDDAFTWIDRADTNGQIIAAISDFTGRWANGTVLVNTVGPSDVNCTGLVSSSGNSTQLEQEAEQRQDKAASAKKKKNSIIIGVVVTLGVLIIIAIGVLVFCLSRRRKTRREHIDIIDAAPRQYDVHLTEGQGQVLSVMPKSPSSGGPSSAGFDPYAESHTGYNSNTSSHTYSHTNTHSDTNSHAARPGFATFPAGRRSKASEAGLEHSRVRAEHGSEGGTSSGPSHNRGSGLLLPLHSGDQDEIIIQHRDGGQPVVRELPPPYATPESRL